MTEHTEYFVELTDMEKDIIGEVMNISMGAAATAMSTILDKKVSITTPRLESLKVADFGFTELEPAMGVIIKYVEGIDGLNMLILRVADFKVILSHLLSIDPTEMTEFDEISISAICEIMNQMMGSASSALATFLGIKINISPPEVMESTSREKVQENFSPKWDHIISIKFAIDIEELVKSEFVCILDPQLAREIIKMSLGESQAEQAEEAFMPAPVQVTDTPQAPPVYQSAPPPAYYQQAPPLAPAHHAPRQQIQATPYSYPQLGPEEASGMDTKDGNLELIMSVPIQITVELGKTKRKIKDIAEFAPGNIVELDRQAGDQVDIVANGRLIARGDVVVVDDNYSVRITEIMKARDHLTESK
ncbi:flagellar motor switch phosphatase FliY [Bacillota bacterium]